MSTEAENATPETSASNATETTDKTSQQKDTAWDYRRQLADQSRAFGQREKKMQDQIDTMQDQITTLQAERNRLSEDAPHEEVVGHLNRLAENVGKLQVELQRSRSAHEQAQADLQAKLEAKEAEAKQVSRQTEQRVRREQRQQTEDKQQANNALNEMLDELDGQYDPAFRNAAVDVVSAAFANDPVSAKDAQGNFLRSDEERHDWIRTRLENEYMRQKLAQKPSASTPDDHPPTDPDPGGRRDAETEPLNAGSGTGAIDENAYAQIKPGSLTDVRTQLERKWAQEAASG